MTTFSPPLLEDVANAFTGSTFLVPQWGDLPRLFIELRQEELAQAFMELGNGKRLEPTVLNFRQHRLDSTRVQYMEIYLRCKKLVRCSRLNDAEQVAGLAVDCALSSKEGQGS